MQTQLPRPPRLGPRPLPLHLATEGWILQMSFAGLMPALGLLNNDSPLSRPIRRLAAEHANQNPDTYTRPWSADLDVTAFVDALTREAKARMDTLLQGVVRYQTHPFHRQRTAPPAIWSIQSACIRDYGGEETSPPVLFVPSLVNRAYILDLAAERSLLAHSSLNGLRAFLLDWGEPGPAEKTYTVDDYVSGVLLPALAHIREITDAPPRLVGYCMGGTLATAAAVLQPASISGLALLAAPWDFHADSGAARQFLVTYRPVIEAMIAAQGEASVDFLQAMFASLDPTLMGKKFRGFAARDTTTDPAQRFVELEDWLNDGVPLVAEVAKQTLFGWYVDNQTMRGTWRVNGTVIDPSRISAPTLAVIPSQDRIVPPQSAQALADRIPGCKVMHVDLGHIGMMAGTSAPKRLYEPLAQWLRDLK
jgi:polyhydroxyalkanoate synthase subunit PhaC